MNVVRSLLMLFLSCSSLMSFAQRGVRLAYIDMDEILENVDDYTTASLLLEKNVATWKEDIAVKKMELKGREEQLQAEKVLLTPELIEDRQNELSLFRSEIVALQTKYFGSQGNYIQQKNKLLKPIQVKLPKNANMILSLIVHLTWLCYIPQKITILVPWFYNDSIRKSELRPEKNKLKNVKLKLNNDLKTNSI
jgi:Skp family chaperone for outer membrane proteins